MQFCHCYFINNTVNRANTSQAQSIRFQFARYNAPNLFELLWIHVASLMNKQKRRRASRTLVTLECAHKWSQSFTLPACADIQNCQLWKINYAFSNVTQHPPRGVQALRSKQSPWTGEFFLRLPYAPTLESSLLAFGRRHEEHCVRVWERVRGGRGRVCTAVEGTRNRYSACTDGDSVEAVTWLE